MWTNLKFWFQLLHEFKMGTLGSSSHARHGNMTSKSCLPGEFWQFNCILKSILWSYWITWIERGGWGPISSPTQRVELPICNKTSRSFITSVYTPSSHSSIQILQAPLVLYKRHSIIQDFHPQTTQGDATLAPLHGGFMASKYFCQYPVPSTCGKSHKPPAPERWREDKTNCQ